MKLHNLNLSKFKSSGSAHTVVPSGEYNCTLERIQEKPSKKGGGATTLMLTWRITDGEHSGNSLPSWFNMAEESCREVFAIMLINMGFDPATVEDTEDLVGGECRLSVELKEGANGPPRNSVKFYSPLMHRSTGKFQNSSGEVDLLEDLPAFGVIM